MSPEQTHTLKEKDPDKNYVGFVFTVFLLTNNELQSQSSYKIGMNMKTGIDKICKVIPGVTNDIKVHLKKHGYIEIGDDSYKVIYQINFKEPQNVHT